MCPQSRQNVSPDTPKLSRWGVVEGALGVVWGWLGGDLGWSGGENVVPNPKINVKKKGPPARQKLSLILVRILGVPPWQDTFGGVRGWPGGVRETSGGV